jgi:NTE family protein
MTEVKRINLALQGGGAHAAVVWGALDRLLEDDRIEVEGISGASAGAVNAVALAYGLYLDGPKGGRAKLEELWRAVSDVGAYFSPVSSPLERVVDPLGVARSAAYRTFDAFTRTLSPYQFNPYGVNPLASILERCIDFPDLRSCRNVQLFLAATNVRTGKIRIFRNKEMSVEVVAASTCLPFLFQAVEIGGAHYWDGGYMGNPALWPFFYETTSDDVVILHVNPIERDDVPTTAPEIMNRINEISFNSSLLRELRAVAFVQKLLRDGWLKEERRGGLRDVRIHSLRTDKALLDQSIETKYCVDWPFLIELKERGREIADAWLAENFDHIGRRSSVDIRKLIDGG